MPFKKGHKGIGGRKNGEWEELKSRVINNCWDDVEDYMKKNPGLLKKFKKQIVLEIIKKSMPTNININGSLFIKQLEEDIKKLADDDDEDDQISSETV